MKIILSVLAGIIAGLAFMFLEVLLVNSMFPYPEGLSLEDRPSFQLYIDSLPEKVFIIRIVFAAFSIFAAGLIGSLTSPMARYQSGVLAALPFACYHIYSLFLYNYPAYYVVIKISLVVLLGFMSILFGATRRVPV